MTNLNYPTAAGGMMILFFHVIWVSVAKTQILKVNLRKLFFKLCYSSPLYAGEHWRAWLLARTHAGIGSALSQVAETLTRPLTGKVREDEERYRLRFEVPGLGKDDVRVYVDDGVLAIHGEKRDVVEEDRGRDGDGECWAAATYHAGLLLPEDAVAEGITAEVRDGVLHVTVPRSPERKRSVTEVKVR